MSRLGVMGGTYDPPHYGHLAAASDVMHALGLDSVLWVVSGRPPHKLHLPVTPANHRLEMVERAIHGNPRFQVSTIELERRGPSYTVETLRRLRDSRPGDSLYFLMGSDEFAALHTWHEAELIPKLAHLAVMLRAGTQLDTTRVGSLSVEVSGRYTLVLVPEVGTSSSEVRRRVRDGMPIRYLVPDNVAAYIEREQLYKA